MRPASPEQWQDAVDAAHRLLTFEIGQLYGLVERIPDVNIAECVQILTEGAEQGIVPTAEFTELRNAALALLEKCYSTIPMLRNSDIVGDELERLHQIVFKEHSPALRLIPSMSN